MCGAEIPSILRGVRLRKHVATVGLALNLTDGEIGDLSKFMGHDKNIHINIYQQPVCTKDILQVSQWLEYAQGDYMESKNGNVLLHEDSISDLEEPITDNSTHSKNSDLYKNFEDKVDVINFDDNVDYIVNQNEKENAQDVNNIHKNTKKNSYTFVQVQRKKWDENSTNILKIHFTDHLRNNKHITGAEIKEVISKNECLHGRHVDQVRSYLQWFCKKNGINKSIKRKREESTVREKRNRVPKCIYTHFEHYIENKQVPTAEACGAMYSKSPSLSRYSPQELINLVKRAIDFDQENY